MSKPTSRSEKKLKRLARYLLEYPRLTWRFVKNDKSNGSDYLDVYPDSDWAGDKVTRRSTSGGMAVLDWSSTQGTIAMSSGEAEYYALVKAAAEGLGIQSLAKDLGIDVTVRLWVDSSAAKSIVSRVGLGKVRHMEVKYLWAQEAHKMKRFEVRKIASAKNPADINTRPKSAAEMMSKLAHVGGYLSKRRSERWADMQDSDLEEK